MPDDIAGALLFPGQGSQTVGMASELLDRPFARERFDAASEVTGRDIARMCLEGPAEELEKTENAQVAIFVTSFCLFEASPYWGGGAVAGAGHSLGEYSALTASGALDFSTAIGLVARRGAAMAEACAAIPGAMAAVLGPEWKDVEEICAERRRNGGQIWTANQNAPGQSVVAGSADDISWMMENGKALGAKRVVRLPVAGAFHSPLMEPASEHLAEALAGCEIGEPAFGVWSNATGNLYEGPDQIRNGLAEQLTSPVRWVDCVSGLFESCGSPELICFGPGDTMNGLARRCVPEASVVRFETLSEADRDVQN